MTSRERVLAAIAHEPTDRVPIDLGGMRSTGIMATAYNRLKSHLGRDHDTLVYDVVQGLAQPDARILDRFDVDVIDLGRAWFTSPDDWRDWTLMDGSPARVPAWFEPEPDGEGGWLVRGDEGQVIGVMPRGQEYVTQTYWPMADDAAGLTERSLADLEHHMAQVTWGRLGCAPWHPGFDERRWEEMRARALKLRRSTDRAIMCAFGGNLMEWSQFLRGFGGFLTDLGARRADAHRLLEALTERHLRVLDRFLDALGDVIDIVQMGDDLGTQHGPQISPAMYREFFFPRHRRIYSRVKERSDLAVFLHSCGGLYELIPDLIEAGIDILNPV
ncbi:MAG: uroporphyrinogen decarboxylase family protein, partial [Armatimonadota bacterium]